MGIINPRAHGILAKLPSSLVEHLEAEISMVDAGFKRGTEAIESVAEIVDAAPFFTDAEAQGHLDAFTAIIETRYSRTPRTAAEGVVWERVEHIGPGRARAAQMGETEPVSIDCDHCGYRARVVTEPRDEESRDFSINYIRAVRRANLAITLANPLHDDREARVQLCEICAPALGHQTDRERLSASA